MYFYAFLLKWFQLRIYQQSYPFSSFACALTDAIFFHVFQSQRIWEFLEISGPFYDYSSLLPKLVLIIAINIKVEKHSTCFVEEIQLSFCFQKLSYSFSRSRWKLVCKLCGFAKTLNILILFLTVKSNHSWVFHFPQRNFQ